MYDSSRTTMTMNRSRSAARAGHGTGASGSAIPWLGGAGLKSLHRVTSEKCP